MKCINKACEGYDITQKDRCSAYVDLSSCVRLKELKPCPFCGNDDMKVEDTEGADYVIRCSGCECHMFDKMVWSEDVDDRAELVKAWNKRV